MKKKITKLTSLMIIGTLLISLISIPDTYSASYNASVNINTTYQTLEGFGAAIAWYDGWVTSHPNKTELYKVMFADSGLDILRLRNQYQHSQDDSSIDAEIFKAGKQLNPSLKLLLCSWSPPSDLKRNGTMNGGTLAKDSNGFVYSKFADYWYNSLTAYAAKGLVPDYISIQNEPDYENTGWETCIFKPTEDSNYPSYGKALDAVYSRINSLSNKPKILAAEAAGIDSNLVQNYANAMDLSKVYGIAHHLYNGGDANNPDSFNSIFRSIAAAYPNKPRFQTEYDYGTAFTTAQLINNSFVEEGVSGYFFWDLIWTNDQRPLIHLDDPNNQSGWSNPKGYSITDFYYTIQHYAKFTDPGYKRVEASCASSDIKITAFASPDSKKLTMILINKGSSESTINLNLNGYSANSSAVYRTVGNEKFASKGSLSGNSVTLPAQSVVTVALDGSSGSEIKKGDLNSDGNVDALDIALYKQYLLGIITDTSIPNYKYVLDLNNDNSIDSLDFAVLKQYLLGKISEF
ncbi:MAG: dockerin type I domain-containing protein [Ruminiclostridium sp.]